MKLLEHFKELSIHPKNADELKGLILELAIQGKLTKKWREENPDVEPASILLERIKIRIEQEEKEKKIKKEKPLPIINSDEIPFNLPSSWLWTRLGELGSTNIGLTYKPSDISGNGVPVLRSSNIQDGVLSLVDLIRVDTNYTPKDVIQEGDLLICARNGSKRLVGKCTIIPHLEEVMVFGAFMAIFRSSVNPYLHLFIQSPQYRAKLDGVETTTINQITQGNLKLTEIPLPPLEEQKAIVSIVNQLFAEVEELEKQTKTLIQLKEDFVTSALQRLSNGATATEWALLQEHFKTFFTEKSAVKKLRESILQLAVQGKLTGNWRKENPDVEPAAALLEKIKAEKEELIKAKKIKKEKPLPEIIEEEIPYKLPEGWVWCRFQDCATIASNLVKPQGYLDLPHIAPDIIEKGNGRLLDYRTIREDGVSSAKHHFFPGQIIYSKIRPNLNKLVEVDFEGLCSADMYPIIPYIFRSYLFKYMLSDTFVRQSVRTDTRVAMPKVNQSELSKILVPIAPIEEQKAIVAKVNALMALCDRLEEEIEQNTRQLEQLMQSCLKEVLRGKKQKENEDYNLKNNISIQFCN